MSITKFGFAAAARTRGNSDSVATLTATTTTGQFTLSAFASTILGVPAGEHVLIVDNADGILSAIETRDNDYLDFCEEAGLDVGSAESRLAYIKENMVYGVVKGFPVLNSRGVPEETNSHGSLEEKKAYVESNFNEMFEAAMASDDVEIKDLLSRDGITKEEQVEILIKNVEATKVPKYMGSKTMNPSKRTGSGVPLNFSNNAMWVKMKNDLEDPNKTKRVFTLDTTNIVTIEMHDGFKAIEVQMIPVGEYEDKEPAEFGKKKKA